MTCERREALLWSKKLETMWHPLGSVSEWHFGHIGVQERGWLSVRGALCLVAAENSRWVWADECGPSEKLPLWAPFSPGVLWIKSSTEGTRHIPSIRTSPALGLWQPLCSAGCEGHKDESGFCLSGRRHRVRWVWGHVYFPKQEVACSWNLGLVQKL